MTDHGNGGEVVRYTTKELLAEIREGIHTVKATAVAHDARITALELRVAEHQQVREEYVPIVDGIVRDLDIKKQVTEALDERADKGFTRKQKLIGLAIGVITVAQGFLALGPDIWAGP